MVTTFFKILAFSALIAVSSAGADIRPMDLLPWPWGSECPFPWTKIEGEWVVRSKGAPNERFVFLVTQTWENGTKVLEVNRYDERGVLIGVGQATAPRNERVVRAVMAGVGPDKGNSYWALVRTYVDRTDKRKRSCSRGKLVTVITIRPKDGAATEDVHYILDKQGDEGETAKP